MRFRWRQRASIDLPWVNVSTLLLIWGAAAPLLAFLLRDASFVQDDLRGDAITYIAVAALVTPAIFVWSRLSHAVSRFFSMADALAIAKGSAAAVLCTVTILFVFTRLNNVPRSVPILHFLVLAGGTIVARAESYLRRRRRNRVVASEAPENIIVVKVSDLSWFYIQMVEEFAADTYHIVALVDESNSLQGRFVHGYPVAGRVRDIAQVIDEYAIHGVRIDRIVLAAATDALAPEVLDVLVSAAAERSIPVDILPDRLGLARSEPPIRDEALDEALPSAEPRGMFWTTKRWFDIVTACLLLVAAAPVALVVAALVLLDCGMPIMFWQVRIGRHGERITVYKFRTLRTPYARTGALTPADRRISWIGSVIRKCHVDELPQLFSVLLGDMSFIGPRPLLPVDLSADASLRFAARPGITGWAQVKGATLLTADEKNAMDEWYVRHASWKLDLLIALYTIKTFAFGMKRDEAAITAALTERSQVLAPVRDTSVALADPTEEAVHQDKP
jgi:lipopolysaccharide/colanic/teichoic acid biosynthesis glycosyltransferase